MRSLLVIMLTLVASLAHAEVVYVNNTYNKDMYIMENIFAGESIGNIAKGWYKIPASASNFEVTLTDSLDGSHRLLMIDEAHVVHAQERGTYKGCMPESIDFQQPIISQNWFDISGDEVGCPSGFKQQDFIEMYGGSLILKNQSMLDITVPVLSDYSETLKFNQDDMQKIKNALDAGKI